jgi:hypothetical protein
MLWVRERVSPARVETHLQPGREPVVAVRRVFARQPEIRRRVTPDANRTPDEAVLGYPWALIPGVI